ncbi:MULTISPECIES: ABC transporter ATP-binding protein [Heyndrickxia]|nr:ABC transporter ATP-binding protein [Heyndrickxia shackletonii]NEZ01794.1 ABC transporter ATP-binding protein [Heyndrickxia shackletonii]
MERFHYSSEQLIDKPFNWKQMFRLLGYVKPYLKTLVLKSFITVLLNTIIRLIIPTLIGVYAIGKGIDKKDGSFLTTIIVIISVLFVMSYIAGILRIRWLNKLGQNVIYDIRKDLFTHVQGLSHNFFDKRSAGSILVRIMNDTGSLQDLFTNGVINLLMDMLMLVGVIVILFTLSPQMTLAVIIILPIMFLISTKLRKKIRMAWQYMRLKQSKLNSHLNESIQGIRVTQAFTQEKENMAFFDGVNYENYDAWRNATRRSAMFRPMVDLTNAVGSAVLIWYGVHLIQHDQLQLGAFVSFAFYLGMFWQPISRMGQVYNQLLQAMASSERIFEYMDEKPLVNEKGNATSLTDIKGHIVFENVEFAYDTRRKALNGINLEMKAGQTIALVGHTGSGKTTIANLISRFYDPTAGSVKIDGYDLREITLRSLRNQISVVLQDTFIFSGTIMENIKFGRPDATDTEAINAAKAIGAHHFIEKLPNGYETQVEERGNILSVGERQLLSFARALLADPKIIILDEATASIDTETEVQIQSALRTLLKGRTSVIIAHRLSTIREADKIFVLDHGNIIEAGNHDELMKHQGEYFRLVKAQFKVLEEK